MILAGTAGTTTNGGVISKMKDSTLLLLGAVGLGALFLLKRTPGTDIEPGHGTIPMPGSSGSTTTPKPPKPMPPDTVVTDETLTAAKADSAVGQLWDEISSLWPDTGVIINIFSKYVHEPVALDVLYSFYGERTVMNFSVIYYTGTLYDTLRHLLTYDERILLNRVIYNNTGVVNYV